MVRLYGLRATSCITLKKNINEQLNNPPGPVESGIVENVIKSACKDQTTIGKFMHWKKLK